MCTVTFAASESKFVLTSSRDELCSRETLPPTHYEVYGNKLFFPKDLQGGGTWIAADEEQKKVACLLNGAFEAHQRKGSYRRSRGQILLESFAYADASSFQEAIDLEGIEPFTMLCLQYKQTLQLYELRWDGKDKYFQALDTARPHLWSSATLYSAAVRAKRLVWFAQWLAQRDSLSAQHLLDFHLATHSSRAEENVLMRRAGGLQTISVSQLRLGEDAQLQFGYYDLVGQEDITKD